MRQAADASDPDRALRRMERDGVVACLVMALAALALGGGRPDVALGVIAGGVLAAISYLAIKGAVDVIVAAARRASTPPAAETADAGPERVSDAAPAGAVAASVAALPRTLRRRQQVLALVNFFIRYALLAVGAYVMLTRLRLHPVGLVAGASSPVAAVAVELVRSLARLSRHADTQRSR
jgi:hypothetical protein